MTIREHGVRYRVQFEGGHKTGFFCDQRDNRRDLARFCARPVGARRLLLHRRASASTPWCSGKAREVTCVDLDEKAVALARENANAQPGPARRSSTPTPSATCGRWRQNGRSFGVRRARPARS